MALNPNASAGTCAWRDTLATGKQIDCANTAVPARTFDFVTPAGHIKVELCEEHAAEVDRSPQMGGRTTATGGDQAGE